MLPILDLKPFGWEPNVNIHKTGAKGEHQLRFQPAFELGVINHHP
jgi:hypothetical protein